MAWAIDERIRRGDLVSADVHNTTVQGLMARLQRAEDTLDRVVVANEGLQERLRESQSRVRELQERNRRLRRRLRRRSGGTNADAATPTT